MESSSLFSIVVNGASDEGIAADLFDSSGLINVLWLIKGTNKQNALT